MLSWNLCSINVKTWEKGDVICQRSHSWPFHSIQLYCYQFILLIFTALFSHLYNLFMINAMVKIILNIQVKSFIIFYVMCLQSRLLWKLPGNEKTPVNTSYIHFQTHIISIWKCELFVVLYCWLSSQSSLFVCLFVFPFVTSFICAYFWTVEIALLSTVEHHYRIWTI